MRPQKLYRTVADIEAATWGLLILGMILKYTGVTDALVPVAGPVHGLAFLTFVVVTVLVWTNNRWSPGRGITGLLSSVIPFCTVPFARSTTRSGLLDGGWRQDGPVLATVVGRPLVTTGALAAVVVVVFAVLMVVGPPFGG
jgi:integral membrane protein